MWTVLDTETCKKVGVEVCMCTVQTVICILEGTVPQLVPGNLPTPETVIVEKVIACRFSVGFYCSGVANGVGIVVD